MAEPSPQLEDGYVRIANEYLEALMLHNYPASLIRFVLAVVRETWGWGKKKRAVPIRRFAELLGVSETRVYQLRADATRHNLVTIEERGTSDAIYQVQKLYMDWLDYSSRRPAGKPSIARPSEARPSEERASEEDDTVKARPSEAPEARPSEHIKDSLKDKQPTPPSPPHDNGEGEEIDLHLERQTARAAFDQFLAPAGGSEREGPQMDTLFDGCWQAAGQHGAQVVPDAALATAQWALEKMRRGERLRWVQITGYLREVCRNMTQEEADRDGIRDDAERLFIRLVGPKPHDHWTVTQKWEQELRRFKASADEYLWWKVRGSPSVQARAEELGLWDDGLPERAATALLASKSDAAEVPV